MGLKVASDIAAKKKIGKSFFFHPRNGPTLLYLIENLKIKYEFDRSDNFQKFSKNVNRTSTTGLEAFANQIWVKIKRQVY